MNFDSDIYLNVFSLLQISSAEPLENVEVFSKAADDFKEYYDFLQCEETKETR